MNAPFPAEDRVINNRSAEFAFKSLFDLECLGISRGTVSDPDEKAIEQFKNSITIKNGRYHVDIPWEADALSKVPNNIQICKAISVQAEFVHPGSPSSLPLFLLYTHSQLTPCNSQLDYSKMPCLIPGY